MTRPRLRVECDQQSIRIYRGNGFVPIVTQNAVADQRPYIHPIIAPDGKGILTENAPLHHPWQHGIFIGLKDINGIGFWEEGLRQNPKDGSFHPKPLNPAIVRDDQVLWQVESEWRDPRGNTMLTETQRWSLYDFGDTYEIDFQWSLHAEIDLTFSQNRYGGLFLRMPYRADIDGLALNSEGQTNDDAEGKRARWVACSMRLDGREDHAGIAYMDHPSNSGYPVTWRVDKQLGISPSRCIAGPWELREGEEHVYHYKIFVFCGKSDPARIESRWQRFATQRHNRFNGLPNESSSPPMMKE